MKFPKYVFPVKFQKFIKRFKILQTNKIAGARNGMLASQLTEFITTLHNGPFREYNILYSYYNINHIRV